MQYFPAFIEGIITFISPCFLPLLPLYVSFFAGGEADEKNTRKILLSSLAFVLGFSVVFVAMGAAAGLLGSFLISYGSYINIIGGIILIVFGLNYLGVFNIAFLNRTRQIGNKPKSPGFISALLLGIIFSLSWTPCVGPLLAAALMQAANSGTVFSGVMMLLCYSAGLGLPFVICAFILDTLKKSFSFINRHYKVINIIAGSLLCIMGILMMTGWLNAVLKNLL